LCTFGFENRVGLSVGHSFGYSLAIWYTPHTDKKKLKNGVLEAINTPLMS